jgi:chromosome segregation ATPase
MKTYKEMNDRIVGLLELADVPTTLYAAARINELDNSNKERGKDLAILIQANTKQAAEITRLQKRRSRHLDYIAELETLNDTNSTHIKTLENAESAHIAHLQKRRDILRRSITELDVSIDNKSKRIETLEAGAASSVVVINTQDALLDVLQNLAEMQDLAAEKVEKERDEATARGDRILVDLTNACKQRDEAKTWNELYTRRANYFRNLSQVMEANEKDTAILYDNAVNESRNWAIHYRGVIKSALEFLQDKEHYSRMAQDTLEINLDSLNL